MAAPEASSGGCPICIFSKQLHWADWEQTGRIAAELGLDGVDLTVRPGGHVLPERVEEDLPRAVEAIRKSGSTVRMMTTAINDPEDERTEAILKAAAREGIRYYRMGYYNYEETRSIEETLADIESKMRGLARLNQQWGLKGDYQNHAGRGYFGASIWDLREIFSRVGSEWVGVQFDLRHATVEGSQNWPIDFRAVAGNVHSLVAKNFRWDCASPKPATEDVPLGEGIAEFAAFFGLLAARSWRGPISLHLEYPLGGAGTGKRTLTIPSSEVVAAIKRDLTVLQRLLAEAGLRA